MKNFFPRHHRPRERWWIGVTYLFGIPKTGVQHCWASKQLRSYFGAAPNSIHPFTRLCNAISLSVVSVRSSGRELLFAFVYLCSVMGDDMMVGFSYNCEGNGCECGRPKESERGSESDNNSMEIIAIPFKL